MVEAGQHPAAVEESAAPENRPASAGQRRNAPRDWTPQTRPRLLPGPGPRYRIYRRLANYTGLTLDAIGGRMTAGPDLETFEAELRRFLDTPNAVCACMARVGIHVALKALIKPGQDVIMSPYTIADVVNMVISAGGRPVFADIERTTCNIDPAEVRRLIGHNTGAVLITHLHGLAAHPIEIRDLCRQKGIPLIEDAAQSFGAAVDGKRLGTIGDAGIYSFGTYKNVNCWYGGAVVTPHSDLCARLRSEMEAFGWQATGFILKRMRQGLLTDIATMPLVFRSLVFWIFRFGYLNDIDAINRRVNTELDLNRHDELPSHYRSRLTPAQARIAIRQLDRVDEVAQIRIRNAGIYREGLEGIPGLLLPPPREGLSHIYSCFPVQVEKRTAFLKWMMRHNRDVAAQHLRNCADLPSFSEFARDCPNARATTASTVMLPTYPRYPHDQIERNIEAIRAYFSI